MISLPSRAASLDWGSGVATVPTLLEESTQSTFGLQIPESTQSHSDDFGYVFPDYEDREISAAMTLRSLGLEADDASDTASNLGGSQTSIAADSDDREEEMTDTDPGVATEVETGQGAHDTDSMRTLVDPSSRSQPDSDSSYVFSST